MPAGIQWSGLHLVVHKPTPCLFSCRTMPAVLSRVYLCLQMCELERELGETGVLVVQGPTVVDQSITPPVSAALFFAYQDKEMLLLPVRGSATGVYSAVPACCPAAQGPSTSVPGCC